MNGQGAGDAQTGGGTAIYNSSGTLAYYRHGDWLGSSRLTTTTSRTVYSDSAYEPFGQQYDVSGTADASFTGQDSDTNSGLYDFTFREFSPSQGRWVSPDPAGAAATNPIDPQSWNRYAYVMGNPLALIDPFGLDYCQINGTEDGSLDPDGCYNSGGIWVYQVPNAPLPPALYDASLNNADVTTFQSGPTFIPNNGSGSIWNRIKGVIHSVVCTYAAPDIVAAKANGGVVGTGVGGSFGAGVWWGLSGSASVSLVADSHGNIGLAFSGSGNPGTLLGGVYGIGASAGGSISISPDAEHISDLNGTGTVVSGNIGPISGSFSADDPATLTVNLGQFGEEGGHVSTAEVGGTVVPQSLTTQCK